MKEVIKIAPKISIRLKPTHIYNNIGQLVIASAWFFYVLFVQSCASTSDRHMWIGEGIQAEAMQDRGELAGAESAYSRLLLTPPDDERRRWIAYKRAELASEQGNVEEAKKRALAVHREKIIDEYGAKSLFLVAQLDQDSTLFWDVISIYPETYAAEKSLKYLVAQAKTDTQRADFAIRLRHQIDTAASSLEDNLLLSEARIYIAINKPNAALVVLRELFYLDESESLADNALWEMAALYRKAQQWQNALDVYALFRNRIESSWFVGTYTPDLVNDSIIESGKISLLFLDDYGRAAAYFEDYLTLFPGSLLADDALWFLAESYRLSGDSEKREQTVERLEELFPGSKYLKRLRVNRGSERVELPLPLPHISSIPTRSMGTREKVAKRNDSLQRVKQLGPYPFQSRVLR